VEEWSLASRASRRHFSWTPRCAAVGHHACTPAASFAPRRGRHRMRAEELGLDRCRRHGVTERAAVRRTAGGARTPQRMRSQFGGARRSGLAAAKGAQQGTRAGAGARRSWTAAGPDSWRRAAGTRGAGRPRGRARWRHGVPASGRYLDTRRQPIVRIGRSCYTPEWSRASPAAVVSGPASSDTTSGRTRCPT
jgi:hypothetical protein